MSVLISTYLHYKRNNEVVLITKFKYILVNKIKNILTITINNKMIIRILVLLLMTKN